MRAKVHGFKTTTDSLTVLTLAPLWAWADWFDVPVYRDTANAVLAAWPATEVEITLTVVSDTVVNPGKRMTDPHPPTTDKWREIDHQLVRLFDLVAIIAEEAVDCPDRSSLDGWACTELWPDSPRTWCPTCMAKVFLAGEAPL